MMMQMKREGFIVKNEIERAARQLTSARDLEI